MSGKNILSVVGVGGVGGYFGGRLAHALQDQPRAEWETHFIARGAHLQAIRSRGLVVETPEGRLDCTPASAVGALDEAPVPDAVLLCVKGYDLDPAAGRIAAHMHPDTVIVPLLNGVDIHARLRAAIPSGHILPACVFVGTHISRPGVITQAGGEGAIVLGAESGDPGFVPARLLELFDGAGISHVWHEDPRPAIWEKFLFIAAFGLVTAASGRSLGEVRTDAALMAEVTGIMGEVLALARRQRVDLPANALDRAAGKAADFPAETRTSLQRDVEAGRRDERDVFGGAIVRLGREHAIPTPCTQDVLSRLPPPVT